MGSGYPAPPQHLLSLGQSSPHLGALHHSPLAHSTSPPLVHSGSAALSHHSTVAIPAVSARSPTAEAPSPIELPPSAPSLAGARPMSPVEQALFEEDEQDPVLRQLERGPARERQSTGSSAGAIDHRQEEKIAYYTRAREDSIHRLVVRSPSGYSSASTSFASPRTILPAPSPPPQRSLPPPPATLPSSAMQSLLPLQPKVTPRNLRPAPSPPRSNLPPPGIVSALAAPSPALTDLGAQSEASDAESLVDPADTPNAFPPHRATMHDSFISNLAQSESIYPEDGEEVVEAPPQPLRTRDEIELAGWREAARQAVEAGAMERPLRTERAEPLDFPRSPPHVFRQAPPPSHAPDFTQPFSHASTGPLSQAAPPARHPFLQSTYQDPMGPSLPHENFGAPASFAMNRSSSSRSYREEEVSRDQRQGSLASDVTIHVGQRDRLGSFGDGYSGGSAQVSPSITV